MRPEDIGFYSIAFVIVGLARVVADLGIPSALIQRDQIDSVDEASSFYGLLVFGVIFNLIVYSLAPVFLLFGGNERVVEMLQVMSASITFCAISSTKIGILNRELRFKLLAIRELIASVAAFGVGLYFLSASSYMAMALYYVAGHFASALFIMFVGPKSIPVITEVRLGRILELFMFGKNVCGTALVTFGSKNLDKLIVGTVLGPASLGLYSLCQNVILNPVQMVLGAVGAFSFPFFSRADEDSRGQHFKKLNYLIAIPAFFVIGVMSARIMDVVVFFDNFEEFDVHGAIAGCLLLSAIGVLVSLCGPILKAAGEVAWLFKFAVIVGVSNVSTVAFIANVFELKEVFISLAVIQFGSFLFLIIKLKAVLKYRVKDSLATVAFCCL
ncbi:oligosaccharide flippase family protein, partial [Pseudomonadales bacterium]|nr:oligosaccharide flippase family protein [Pseudomonadales bacterium]